VSPTFTANTSVCVCGVGAVLEVVSTGCRQGSLQLLGPLLISPGQSPHLIGSQAKITEHRTEWLPAVDRVEELLSHFGGEPLLSSGSAASSLVVAVRAAAQIAPAPGVPACIGAVPSVCHHPKR
jgi:hypothetical protein